MDSRQEEAGRPARPQFRLGGLLATIAAAAGWLALWRWQPVGAFFLVPLGLSLVSARWIARRSSRRGVRIPWRAWPGIFAFVFAIYMLAAILLFSWFGFDFSL